MPDRPAPERLSRATAMDNYEFCAGFAAASCPGSGGRVLDYGCGAGQIVHLLRQRGCEAFGCEMFYGGGSLRDDVAREYLTAGIIRDMPDRVIPFPSDSFDVVVSNQVLEHVPELERALAEIARVLRRGGVLLALFPDRGVWREGHSGIPLLHRFPSGSRLRIWYAAFWRRLGLGHYKGDKHVLQWSRGFCDWLDQWTYYRDYAEIRRTFDRHLTAFTHHEVQWLDARFGGRLAVAGKLPRGLKRLVVRKGAGLVVTCRKPDAGRELKEPSAAVS